MWVCEVNIKREQDSHSIPRLFLYVQTLTIINVPHWCEHKGIERMLEWPLNTPSFTLSNTLFREGVMWKAEDELISYILAMKLYHLAEAVMEFRWIYRGPLLSVRNVTFVCIKILHINEAPYKMSQDTHLWPYMEKKKLHRESLLSIRISSSYWTWQSKTSSTIYLYCDLISQHELNLITALCHHRQTELHLKLNIWSY